MQHYITNYHRGQRKMILVVKFFRIFELLALWFLHVYFNIVHNVETIFHLPLLEAASSNFF